MGEASGCRRGGWESRGWEGALSTPPTALPVPPASCRRCQGDRLGFSLHPSQERWAGMFLGELAEMKSQVGVHRLEEGQSQPLSSWPGPLSPCQCQPGILQGSPTPGALS